VLTVGVAKVVAQVVQLSAPPVHVYVAAPAATSVVVLPEQTIVSGLAVTVGNGFMVTVLVIVVVQPQPFVAVRVTGIVPAVVKACEGDVSVLVPPSKAQLQVYTGENREVDESTKLIDPPLHTWFGMVLNAAFTLSTFMVSSPRLKLVQPELSLNISFGTYAPGVL
jgi:hypothetical protein